jgi:hypothetical protein
MPENTTSVIFIALSTIALQLAIVFLLARKYLRTRDVGFLWLGAAVVIWPVVSRLLDWGKHFVIDSRWSKLSHIGSLLSLTAMMQQLAGTVLLFLAVFYLSGMNREGSGTTPAMPIPLK